ncbi:hypothetical protein B0T19DRAFT_126614 [Cercophora scortea]|uniref:Uncharacterized protein n=1 Tax=Cercophora scortea TaxID=314031 RepID=A0AAE0IY55_9PEZI|nr:hypothetical protein B0T19DRAFT_126614 [Cercophora scortea]
MRSSVLPSSVVTLSLAVALAAANSVVYVTDLAIYTALAPCAQSAISDNVQYLTNNYCPEAVTELQACVCTKNNNMASIASGLSSSISYSCGSTASEDQKSAATVLSAYCNQDKVVAFPTPTIPVSVYITDIPQMTDLAPCASGALSYAVLSLTNYNCPPDAPALASCACSKNQNALVVSQAINSNGKYSCSSHTADISSAQAMFQAYCALNNGTSDFPTTSNPPGEMTYYITDLPQYNSLASCAASALSYAVQYQTNDLCPEAPMALASCACMKDEMTGDILSSITSSVKYACESTATDDISSAVSVYNFYCSAAKGLVNAVGVTASASVPTRTPTPKAGSTGTVSGPRPTSSNGVSDGTTGPGTGGDNTQDTTANKSSGPKTAMIAGVAIGAVVAIGAIAGLIFLLVKQSQKRKALAHTEIPDDSPPPSEFYSGKQELPDTSIAAHAPPLPPSSPAPSTLRVGSPRHDNVSPVSAHASAFTPPPPHGAELNGQAPAYPPMPNSAELYGQNPAYSPHTNAAELHAQGYTQQTAELQGQPWAGAAPGRQELMGQPQQRRPAPPPPTQQQQQQQPYSGYAAPGQQRPIELQPAAGWQAGPVPELHEMDGGSYGHAR